MKEQHSPLTFIAMVFGVAGFITGILMAPKSGRETRQLIANKKAELQNRIDTKKQEWKVKRSESRDVAQDATATIGILSEQ